MIAQPRTSAGVVRFGQHQIPGRFATVPAAGQGVTAEGLSIEGGRIDLAVITWMAAAPEPGPRVWTAAYVPSTARPTPAPWTRRPVANQLGVRLAPQP
ncbi:hypothetical protein [Xanthomonas fragariae]|uniref:hypothetical protein n=1 Tax=Xanthomonas fragariae TaxID=48664 RepID=UPI001EDD5B26|nr:hypothetical protein [Xanthomonas fragariae]